MKTVCILAEFILGDDGSGKGFVLGRDYGCLSQAKC